MRGLLRVNSAPCAWLFRGETLSVLHICCIPRPRLRAASLSCGLRAFSLFRRSLQGNQAVACRRKATCLQRSPRSSGPDAMTKAPACVARPTCGSQPGGRTFARRRSVLASSTGSGGTGSAKSTAGTIPLAAGRRRASPAGIAAPYCNATSVMAWVQAPSGAAEITGSEPPDSSVSTVRW